MTEETRDDPITPTFTLLETSENTREVDQARFDLAARMGNLVRDKENTFFNSKYVPLDKVLDVIREPLHEVGLLLTQAASQSSHEVCVETRLTHVKSGQWVSVKPSAPFVPDKKGNYTPQGVGAATTYLRRYGLMPLLGLAETDDDGNLSSGTPMDERPSWVGPLNEEELTVELRKLWRSIDTAGSPEKLDQALWKYQEVIDQCKADLPARWDGSDGVKGLHQLLEARKKIVAPKQPDKPADPEAVIEEIENRLSGVEGMDEFKAIKAEYDSHAMLESDMYRARVDDIFNVKRIEIEDTFDGSSD